MIKSEKKTKSITFDCKKLKTERNCLDFQNAKQVI